MGKEITSKVLRYLKDEGKAIVKCSDCHGHGGNLVPKGKYAIQGEKWVKCETCKGIGVVKVTLVEIS